MNIYNFSYVIYILIAATIINATDQLFNNEYERDSFYKWFGLTRRDFDADKMKKAYRKFAMQYHPDKNADPEAGKIFAKITRAAEVLTDDKLRSIYNQGGLEAVERAEGSGGAGAQHSAEDFFRSMFGDGFGEFFGHGGPARGPIMQAELEVPLEHFFTGNNTELSYARVKVCSACHGTGAEDSKSVKACKKCDGNGAYVRVREIMPGFYQQQQVRCEVCSGRGRTFDKPCKKCDGQRAIKEAEKVTIEIEVGALEGEVIRFPGMADQHPEREAGDLAIILKSKSHPLYQRDGAHLYTEVHLTLREALLGFSKNITQLDGTPLELKRSAVTQPGFEEVVRGAGMPRKSSPKKRGDLFIKYHVILPLQLSAAQRDIFSSMFTSIPDKTEL